MQLICDALNLYVVVVIAAILLSWFPMEPGSGLAQVRITLYRVVDPVLAPIRNLIGSSFGGFDLSPMILILGIQLLVGALC